MNLIGWLVDIWLWCFIPTLKIFANIKFLRALLWSGIAAEIGNKENLLGGGYGDKTKQN